MAASSSEVARFVAAFRPGVEFGECQTIGFTDGDGHLIAGVVFHEWEPEHERIEMSVGATSRRWITQGRAKVIFDYPFSFCRLVWGKTENPAVVRIFKSMGGDVYPIPGLWTVVTLTADQWAVCRGKL